MKVSDLFESPAKIFEMKDPKSMSIAELESEIEKLDAKPFKDQEKWERARKGQLQSALNGLNAKAAEDHKAKIKLEKKHKQSKKEIKDHLLDVLYDKVMNAIGDSFPDGDPSDAFSTWMNHNDLTMSDVDKVMRKHEGKSYNRYLADLWDDYANDTIADAESAVKKGKDPYATSLAGFFKYDKETGKITKEQNPWK